MRRFLSANYLLPVAGALLAVGAAGAAEHKAPKDFTVLKADEGTGEVLIRQTKDAGSAKELLSKTFDALASSFDDRPKALAAVTNGIDAEAQATFIAFRDKVPYAGLAVVHVGVRDSVIGVAYDRAAQFDDSKATLTALLSKHLPEAPEAPKVDWEVRRVGDGKIKVPSDWKLNVVPNFKVAGVMVDASGPQGEGHFGLWTPTGPPFVDERTTPVDVIKGGGPIMAKAAGFEWKWKGLINKTKAEGFPGKTEWVLFDADVTVNGKTTTVRTLELISVMNQGFGQFLVYWSCVSAPAETFDRDFPILLEIWGSYQIDDAVFRKRLNAAAESMQETARIIQDVNAARQRVMARANDDWSEVIRGTSQVHDDKYDTIKEVSSDHLDRVLKRLNEHEGYKRWTIIPLKDINNP